MNRLVFGLFLLSCGLAAAQRPLHALYNTSFAEPVKGSTDFRSVKKLIYIIYNDEHCTFYVDGKGPVLFRVRGYETKSNGDYLHTSFSSLETGTTPDGWYGIMIDESKDEVVFQVNLPNGYTYIVQDAKKYSELGPVKGNIVIKNYKQVVDSMRIKDSIYKSKQ